MGYLQINNPSIPNFTKAVISLWFRIPAEVIAAVSALNDSPAGVGDDGWNGVCYDPPLYKIIPLITFGSAEVDLNTGNPVSPSFIGVDCSPRDAGGPGSGRAALAVNLQTPGTCSFNKPPEAPELEHRPECYYMGGYGSSGSDYLHVTADQWHHILVSFDISTSCGITFANAFRSPPDNQYVMTVGPKFSWAFDDVDHTGPSMYPSSANEQDAFTSHGPEYIIPNGFFSPGAGPGDISATPIEDSTDFVVTINPSSIAQGGHPIGIPASASWVDNVYNIEVAKMQFFTGNYINAGSEESRRAFVTSAGAPEDPAAAIALLGMAPKISFNKSADWIAGNNKGGAGGFTPNGTILKYEDGPTLGD